MRRRVDDPRLLTQHSIALWRSVVSRHPAACWADLRTWPHCIRTLKRLYQPDSHATRAVHIAGTTTNPDSAFVAQIARNLTDEVDGFLAGKRYLILDGDTKFTARFKRILHDAGVEVVRTAYQAPNMNAFAERWVLSVKAECLSKMILFGAESLRRALREYGAHFHGERPHQGLGNELIEPRQPQEPVDGAVVESERLGGLLRSYRRVA